MSSAAVPARLELDLEQARAFLGALTGESAAAVTFQSFADVKAGGEGPLARWRHGTLDEHAEELEKLNFAGGGVYVMVNAGDGLGRKAENVVRVRALFADRDTPEARPPALEPSFSVTTSEGHAHDYLLVAGELPLEEFTPLQKRIAAWCRSDPKVCDLPRVARVPGFFHRKGPPTLVQFVPGAGRAYTREEIIAAHPIEEPVPAARPMPAAAPMADFPLSDRVKRAAAYLAKIEGAVSGQGGHDTTWSAAQSMVRGFSLPPLVAFDLLLNEWNSTCIPPWSEKELWHKVEDAASRSSLADGYLLGEPLPRGRIRLGGRVLAGAEPGPATTPPGPPPSTRPEIVVKGGNLPAIVTAAEGALLVDGGDPIFQRGDLLVRVTRTSDVTVSRREVKAVSRGIERPPGSPVIVSVEEFYFTERLTRAAAWMKPDSRSHSLRPIDCPPRIARHLMARVGEWRVPVLRGLIETPTLRPDGSLLDRPGYDEATGLLYDPGAAEFPSISEHPGRREAEAAMSELLEVLKGFPFVSEIARAAAVTMLLTPLVRRSLQSAPLFAIAAPTMGSGKSLLADCASLIATGRRAAAMTQAPDDAEDQKRWLSALMAGDLIILIDNVSRPLGSDSLNSILTQETYRARVLGGSKQTTVSTAVTILATGNNLTIEGDLRTRVIPIDLDPRMERPEERHFDVDLLEWIPRHRGELVKAGLTVLSAYHVAGRPAPPEPVFGRFEEWSAWARGAVMWLGLLDPCLGRRQLENRDPVTRDLRALLANWHAATGGRRVTTSELIREANLPANSSLNEALVEIAGDKTGAVNARRLGRALMAFERRIESGLRIVRAGERSGTALWEVEKAEEGPASGGLVGLVGLSLIQSGNCHGSDISRDGLAPIPRNPRNPLESFHCDGCGGSSHRLSRTGKPICVSCFGAAS